LGGAGIAAYRIHEALLENGIDSHFICLDERFQNGVKECSKLQQVTEHSVLKSVVNKINRQLKNRYHLFIFQRDNYTNKLKQIEPKLLSEKTSLPYSPYNLLEDPYIQNADIIHLHWVADMLDYPSFFKKNKKRLFWTLHDMNPFKGIFHFEEDEDRNRKSSGDLNLKVLGLKEKTFSKAAQKISIVCPSEWLLNSALNSKSFKESKGYCIRYPLNTEIFRPGINLHFKKSLKIPEQNTVLLFVAKSTDIYRKGFDLLMEALKVLKSLNVTLLVIGNASQISIPGIDIRFLGNITERILLREYYSLADALILPSREDNLPNVMLEAMACGTPVLSFNVGGMGEIIRDGFNGLKAYKTEAGALSNIMNEFIKTKGQYSSKAIRNFALENFSNSVIAEKYKEVYKSSLQVNA
jgi:glycosyltransferase involved in cell wall biosynthesis